jgi:hypothetical protein
MGIKNRIRSHFLIFIIGLALMPGRVGAQQQSWQNDGNWKVGVCRFEGQDLLPQYRRFTYQIPTELFQTIARCPSHSLSSEEQQGRQAQLNVYERMQLEKELHGLLEQRASEFIEAGRTNSKQLKEIERSIAKKRTEIGELLQKDPSEWSLTTRPACVLADKNGDGALYTPPRVPLKVWTEEQNLDCLIQGRIEALDDLLYIEVSAYLNATNSSELLYRGTFFPSEVDQLKDELVRELRSFLYAEEWGDITLKIEPSIAQILIDGVQAQTDETGTVRYLDPGLHSIVVSAPGYTTQKRTVESKAETRKLVELSLEPQNPRTWIIDSDPRNAAVFLNSIHVGTTPLILKEQVAPANVLLTRTGYTPRMFVIEEDVLTLEANLHPIDVNLDTVVARSRRRFYHGLAGFLLSLPLTVVSYGLSSEYAYAYNSALTNPSAGMEELERLHARSTLWYTAYAGSMLLNGILLSDTVLHMWRYIKSSQEY